MKKWTVLILCMAAVLSLAACGYDNTALTVDGENISVGLYTYYLDKVISSGEFAADSQKEQEKAVRLCCEALGAKRLMAKENITLSTAGKREIAEETEKLWSLFGAYYEKAGVSKADLNEATAHEIRKQELLEYYFGEKGKKPVADSLLRKKFSEEYVGFRCVEASLTRVSDLGETIALSAVEKKKLKSDFTALSEQINSGKISFDRANEVYNEGLGLVVTQAPPVQFIGRDDPIYGGEFYARLSAVGIGKAKVITTATFMYLVQRLAFTREDEETYQLLRADILSDLKMAEVEKKIESVASSLSPQRHEKNLRRAAGMIRKAR